MIGKKVNATTAEEIGKKEHAKIVEEVVYAFMVVAKTERLNCELCSLLLLFYF